LTGWSNYQGRPLTWECGKVIPKRSPWTNRSFSLSSSFWY
jgi:hypothetical protein